MIDFDKVRFTYDGNTFVLNGTNLHVVPGEFVCILGGNGSGKSTLAKHINALLLPDEGRVRILDHDTTDAANLYFIRSSAGMVFQNPDDQIVASLVENDVAFGPENLGLPAETLRERVTHALAHVGLQGFETVETASLSGGQKQRLAIAGVLAMDPKILVLDEASAMLDPRGRSGLLRVCRELNESGMTIVMITHFMEEAACADRVLVLDNGTVAAQGPPEEVLANVAELEARSLDVPFAAKAARRLQEAGVAVPDCVTEDALVDALAHLLANTGTTTEASTVTGIHKSEVVPRPTTGTEGAELVRFEQVSYTYHEEATLSERSGRRQTQTRQDGWGADPYQEWAIRDIDFCLCEGEFFGIAGHTGSGKSTLLQHMNGLLHPTRGRVLANGADLANKANAAHARQQVGLVFQYPENQLFAATVYEDVAFGPRNLGCDEQDVQERYEQAMQLVGLDAHELREASPFELSGGQQRRVAFAGVLAMRPSVLVLDEPAAGLDPQAHADFLELIRGFHAQGMTVAMVSHNMDDLARLCNRILVLDQGKQYALGTPTQVFADAQACKAIGLDVPSVQRVANALEKRGVVLKQPCEQLFNLDSLVDTIAGRCGKGRA